MKTKAILMLICIGLLTSCAGKFGVMKRRYNKGYYVSHTGNTKQPHKPEARKSERLNKAEPTVAETFAKTDFAQDPDLQTSPRAVAALPAKKSQDSRSQEPGQQNKKASEKTTFASTRDMPAAGHEIMALTKQIIDANKINSGGDSDVHLVLLVILAILLPPLAVYLKNKTIDQWFWITLILALLGFTGFVFVYGGLFWLAAVVIALMYVLDAL